MKKEEMDKLTQGIQEKIGKEASALIADDIGRLVTDNAQMNNSLENKDKQINKLKQDKENLITTNGNLLQQIGMGEEPPKQNERKEEKQEKVFSFKSAFDEKGHFKK